MSRKNRQFILDQIPKGKLSKEHFRLTEAPVPSPDEGEVLLRVRYVSLDAANRAWMLGPTYRAALKAGDVMAGGALAEVVESRSSGFKPGDLVIGDTGWREYAVVPAATVMKVMPREPLSHAVSVYGVAGLTAYFGLLECGRPKAGDTVVVSAAAGSVGSIVGQIARIKGCRVVGIAGGPEKCALLTSQLGFDAAVDYKRFPGNLMEFYQALQAACGGGIDVYFDNVGGETLDACLFGMKEHGRIAACGAVSRYDGAAPYGVQGTPAIISKRLTVRGFIVTDFFSQAAQALSDLEGWVRSGELKVLEDIVDGFESLPAALVGLLAGDNIGKRMVRVA
jgi:NADPH-dependent curcumin reductase CurA